MNEEDHHQMLDGRSGVLSESVIFYVMLHFIGSGKMLETIAIILIILWALGLVTSVTMGGLVHVLLVVAIVVILIRVIQGRRL